MPSHELFSKTDSKVRPQDDFFRYAGGPWLKANPIPRAKAIWRTFDVLNDEVLAQLRGLLEKLDHARSLDAEEEKLRDYYRVAMDEQLAEKLGADPIAEELARIDAVDSRSELPSLIARLHTLGIAPFWYIDVDADLKRNTVNRVVLFQAGTCLPERDYYLRSDAKSRKLRAQYQAAIARLMRLAGWSAAEAKAASKTVLALETRLAKAGMSQVQLRDIPGMYNKMSVAALTKKAKLDWKTYFADMGIESRYQRALIVAQPAFMAECAAILGRAPLADIKTYLAWHLVESSAPYLDKRFDKAHFDFFGKVISGRKEQDPRWKRAVNELSGNLGFLLGRRYVKAYFPESAKKRVDALIDDLFAAYRARMTALPWMSVKTMAKAIEKLDAMRRKIGYPDKWRSYAAFKPDASSFLAMEWAAARFHMRRTIGKLPKPVDRSEWGMTPQTVNAYCDFILNEIAFPAAFLQKPFFDKDWDDAINYGALGSVIGHELTHAFDDQGCQFDKNGVLRNWWSKSDKEQFDAQAKKLVRQYSSYTVIGDVKCSGELTLSENIADIGGLAIAYDALARRLGRKLHVKQGRHTPAQRFFIAYAQGEMGAIRPAELRRRLRTDFHAPSMLRVNAALPNLQAFHDAFDIKPGDRMYRKPADRVSIW